MSRTGNDEQQGAHAVEEIRLLIVRATMARDARSEQAQAFGEVVRRFQDMAFACAYAMLGDFHLAEDAAQEAFISAWRNLDQLRQPEAFPGWFKRIVLTQCHRLLRGKQLATVSLEAFADLPSLGIDPSRAYERREQQHEVLAAIGGLAEHERMVVLLFYIGDYAQQEIAAFLEIPVTTVKKRLFDARRKLRERMLDMVRDTLQEQRPSRNEQFAETVALFNAALESFVAKIKHDRYIVAAILFGSLSHDTVWRKSDIDIILVARDDKQARDFALVEHGVNIHAVMMPRSAFKRDLEGVLQGSFFHSAFALSTLLYTNDDSIRAYYENARHIGDRDRQLRLMIAGGSALGTLAKAEKWLVTRHDVAYSFLWLMYSVQDLATIEVLLAGELTGREVVPQALKINPTFFKAVYSDLIDQPKSEATIKATLDQINAYIDQRLDALFGPILMYLQQEGGVRSASELDLYFKQQAQAQSLAPIYEWLADKGIIQKVSAPLRLTHKSQVTVDEAAYYYDGAGR